MNFTDALAAHHEAVKSACEHAQRVGMEKFLADVGLDDCLREEFRIAVIGAFKAGKSSVINALLGEPIVPAAQLPCTSGLIELRRGTVASYLRLDDGRETVTTREDYLACAGDAVDQVERRTVWRISVPSDWLPDGLVLVDTPGLGEAARRDEISLTEARRADAVLLVINARQPGRVDEREIANQLRARGAHVIVIANRLDGMPGSDQEKVVVHVRDRVGDQVCVVPFSAREALEGTPAGASRKAALRGLVSDTLFHNPAGHRLAALHRRTTTALDLMLRRVADWERDARDLQTRLANDRDATRKRVQEMEQTSKRARRLLERTHDRILKESRRRTRDEWDQLCLDVLGRRSQWTSTNPPRSQDFARDISYDAKRSLEAVVTEFLTQELIPMMQCELEACRSQLGVELARINSDGGLAIDLPGLSAEAEDGSSLLSGSAVIAIATGIIISWPLAVPVYAFLRAYDWLRDEQRVKAEARDKLATKIHEHLRSEGVRDQVISAVDRVVGQQIESVLAMWRATLQADLAASQHELAAHEAQLNAALEEGSALGEAAAEARTCMERALLAIEAARTTMPTEQARSPTIVAV